jgi:2-methylcitrate dehydratase PrpD
VVKTSLSEKIAEYTLCFSLQDVPPKVQQHAKLMILDAIGGAMAAYYLKHAVSTRKVAIGFGSRPQSTLWGTMEKVGMADAVLANAALIHGMDYDDTHVGGVVHPSASVVSTAFTVGEAAGSSGEQILGAIICGYEIIIRLALAARGGFHDRGFHGTGIVAPFASACVAAKLLDLPQHVLVNALGICGSQAAGLQEFLHDGSWVKKIHPGWGSHAAIYALQLAKGGLTGPREVFEGSYGLYQTHLGTVEGVKETFADLGQKWLTAEISIKRYPCCHMIHSFSDCMFALLRQYKFTDKDIKEIECHIEKRCYHIVCSPESVKKRPTSDYGMRFSLPYIVAMSVRSGKMSPLEIDKQYMTDPAVLEMIDKVHCVEDETVKNPGHFPGWIKVTLLDGTVYQKSQKYERGAAENPIDTQDIIAKYNENASINLPQENVNRILSNITNLEKLEKMEILIQNFVIAARDDNKKGEL